MLNDNVLYTSPFHEYFAKNKETKLKYGQLLQEHEELGSRILPYFHFQMKEKDTGIQIWF